MRKRQRTGWRSILMQLFVATVILLVFHWGMSLPQDDTFYGDTRLRTVNHGWAQLLDGEPVALDTLGDSQVDDEATEIVLEHAITSAFSGRYLAFYAEHQEVKVSVGDQVLYQLCCPEYMAFFQSPGRAWVNVKIPAELAGETLRVTLRSQYPLYQSEPRQMYSLPEGKLFLAQLDFLWLRNLVALLLLGLALITYINMRLWRDPAFRRFLYAMGNVYLFVGLWLCSEVNILGLWVRRAPLSAVMAMLFLRIVPVAIYEFARTMLAQPSRLAPVVGVMTWANLLVPLVLQFCFGVSLLHTLFLNVITVVFACAVGFWEIFLLLKKGKNRTYMERIGCHTAWFLIGALLECHIYMNYHSCGQWLGVPLASGCMVFALISHMYLVHFEAQTAADKHRLEQEHIEMRKQPLNQQINAHFLYNTLNTISAYCKEDPAKADKALQKMAQYMRAYTSLVGTEDYVLLDEELSLIERYLEIQNMRFDGNIHYTIDNQCDDVLLPPLALQPLVENAVNHGLKKRHHMGEIRICAHQRQGFAEILVSDNGVGFDTTEHTGGVGLRNLNARITAMGGHVRTVSTPGQGTSITLVIPLLQEESETEWRDET